MIKCAVHFHLLLFGRKLLLLYGDQVDIVGGCGLLSWYLYELYGAYLLLITLTSPGSKTGTHPSVDLTGKEVGLEMCVAPQVISPFWMTIVNCGFGSDLYIVLVCCSEDVGKIKMHLPKDGER